MKPGKKNKPTPGSFNEQDVVKVCRLLSQGGGKYLVVGGAACNLHGLIRATKDVDLLIPKNQKNTETVLKGLEGLTFGIARELDATEVSKKTMTIIGDNPRVDLLTVANTVKYEEAKKSSLIARIHNVQVPYVDLQTLIKTKQTGRLQDLADIEKLKLIMKNKSR
jgi:hypothetical protein